MLLCGLATLAAAALAALAALAAALAALAALTSEALATHHLQSTATPHSDKCADLFLKLVNLYNKNNNGYNKEKRKYINIHALS